MAVATLAGWIAGGCGGGEPEPRRSLASDVTVELTASPERVWVGSEDVRVRATVMNRAMCVVPAPELTFASSDPSVAEVVDADGPGGRVRAVSAGRATITGRLGEASGSVELEVLGPRRTPTGVVGITTTSTGQLRFHASLLPPGPDRAPPPGGPPPPPPAGRVRMTVDGVSLLDGYDGNRPGNEWLAVQFEGWEEAGRALGLDLRPGTTHAVGFRSDAGGAWRSHAFTAEFTVPPPGEAVRWLRSSPGPEG